LLTYSFGVIKWSKTNLQNINIQTRVLFTKFCKHHPKSAIERFNLPRENGGRGFSNLEILQDIVEPNIPDTVVNIKQKSLHGRYFKELEQPEKIKFRLLMHGLKNQIFTLRLRVLYLQYKIVL
jgi:hypothetical protein